MKKIYPVGGILLIINLILFIFVIFPLIQGIKKSSKDLILEKSELFLLEQRKNNLENLKKISDFYQKDLEKIDASFVDPETPIAFIGFLEKTAVSSQVGIEISLAGGKSDVESLRSFNVALESSFPNFLKFLEKLENGPYPIEVSTLNMGRTLESKISATLIFSVLAKK